MSASSISEELDARLSIALDPFEDMCAPKSQNSIPAFKAAVKAPKSPVKRALMLRPPTSQTISDIALLQREKAQLSQQMNQELEMSRLRQDKLSEMLAAASSAQQAAEQQSRRLEIKFARSDKGHALLRSAKLQADVVDLEAQVSQLQGDCHHKGELLASSQAKVVELHTTLTQHAHRAGVTDEHLLIENARLSTELECSRQHCQEVDRQVNGLRQQCKLADEAATQAAAEVAKLQKRNDDLSQKLQEMAEQQGSASHKAAADAHRQQLLVAELESSMQSAASRHADDLDETRRGYEDRLSALRSELEQQEVDKAALLDIAQDLEDKVSGQAADSAEANLAAAHNQIAQLQSQLHQEQTRAGHVTHLEAQATQLRRQLQQQLLATEEQATAAAALSVGFDQERASWQEERSSFLTGAKAADAESSSLHKTVESLRQGGEKAMVESRQASQQWAVAQADLRATRHQLKLLQQQVTPLRLQLSDCSVIDDVLMDVMMDLLMDVSMDVLMDVLVNVLMDMLTVV
ncbi:hypothetical protein ABBQ38_011946 [Trebouxia sp. C0009 RCD-2024]